jgi:N-acetylgalactosamine kinase
MQSATCHKVCFAIDGKPAINRAIETYNACGIRHHVVVVGSLAGQVVETVGSQFDNATFAYQRQAVGTANAAAAGLKAIESMGAADGEILLVAGDRLIEPSVLEQFFDTFYAQSCDAALLASPRRDHSSQGRIVESPDGALLAIVEAADIGQRAVYRRLREALGKGEALSREAVEEVIRDGFPRGAASEKKLATAFGPLWKAVGVEKRTPSRDELLAWIPDAMTQFLFPCPGGKPLSLRPEEVDRSPLLNNSIYLVKASALRFALDRLDRDNAQQEEYLSDLVGILAKASASGTSTFRMKAFRVDNPTAVMGYNDPAELLEVEAHIQSMKRARPTADLPELVWHRSVEQWIRMFEAVEARHAAAAGSLWSELVSIYSDDPSVLTERAGTYLRALRHAAAVLGAAARVLIVRSPGRVNALGRHVDHQGGHCNLMTISYETLMVVHARQDDRIHLHNLDREQFGTREFSIGELVMDLPWDDWMSLVNSEKVAGMVRTYGGDWSQYVKAAVLRLQKKFSNRKLRGMDVFVTGNVPMAAGLSSSSSLVVGAAEATIAVNRLDTFPAQLVDLCGEGEWFVGTRGGSADHAAVKLGQRGKVIKVTFFDFAVQDVVPFPDDYVLVVCDSGIKAKKSASSKDLFNHRVSCYRIGFRLIRRFFPQYTPLLHHLRDVNVRTLRVPLSWIYRILLHLPEQATRDELREMLPGENLDPFFATHEPPADGLYPIRGIVLYGLAECERSRLFADDLKAGRIEEIGRLMNVSHDGDRVSTFLPSGEEKPFRAPTSNGHILNLMEDLESGDPERVLRAQIQWQPGRYYCSLPAIDKMVDLSLRTEGIVGAQLAGAGLGGCMMVLARRDAVPQLVERLTRDYYEPAAKPPAILICKPIAGSGVLMGDQLANA